jgi:hypothetical protein
MLLPVNIENIQKFCNKKYNDFSNHITLSLANILNKRLRKIILNRGLDPDYVIEPTFGELLKGAIEQGIKQKRGVIPVHFIDGNYISDPNIHPIVKSRISFTKKQEELANLPVAEINDPLTLLVDEQNLLSDKAVSSEVILEIQDETVPMPRKHPRKPVKNRRNKKAIK